MRWKTKDAINKQKRTEPPHKFSTDIRTIFCTFFLSSEMPNLKSLSKIASLKLKTCVLTSQIAIKLIIKWQFISFILQINVRIAFGKMNRNKCIHHKSFCAQTNKRYNLFIRIKMLKMVGQRDSAFPISKSRNGKRLAENELCDDFLVIFWQTSTMIWHITDEIQQTCRRKQKKKKKSRESHIGKYIYNHRHGQTDKKQVI